MKKFIVLFCMITFVIINYSYAGTNGSYYMEINMTTIKVMENETSPILVPKYDCKAEAKVEVYIPLVGSVSVKCIGDGESNVSQEDACHEAHAEVDCCLKTAFNLPC